jgi:hydrogenase maturation protease
MKNQRRFNFGGVYPPEHTVVHPDDPDRTQTEVLLEADVSATLEVAVRFLQVVQRSVFDATGQPVDELTVDGEHHLSWEEAIERELDVPLLRIGGPGTDLDVTIAPGEEREPITDAAGRPAGALSRSWDRLDALVSVSVHPLETGLWRVTVEARNLTAFNPALSRQLALRRTLCSTHALLRSDRGAFVSMTDPPAERAAAAEGCRNIGTWPVLVGERPDRSRILSSPIILEDYPRVAPESPGDLFDGGEIDQMLVLNILALSDEEKAEMRASDPRAREILERTEALTPEQLMALHGTIREFGMTR